MSYKYDRLGRKTALADQRGVSHLYSYDNTTGRLTFDDAEEEGSVLPSGVDGSVVKIGYTYDDFGRPTKITSYDTDDAEVNEVAFEYGPWGAVTKSMQNHTTGTTSTDPNVQYAYEDGIVSNEAKFVRPNSVTYPGPSARRVVYYNYASTGVGAALSRLGEIADDHGDQSGRTRYASYMYLGAGTMVDANYPAVTGIPALTYGSRANSYSGLDRFGRVVNQKWQNQSGTPTVQDQFTYGYDRASNRLSREVSPDGNNPAGLDDSYQYDNLDRLMKRNRGTLSGGSISDANANLNQAWAEDVSGWQTRLDPVGNWTKYLWDANGGGNGWTTQSRAHNKANEIAGNGGNPIYGTGADWVDPAYDAAGNMTAGPQPGYETADANTQLYKYDAWNRLTKIYRDADADDLIDDPGELVATYSYDGQNRRIRKVVENGESDITYDYYYNENWQVLEVRKGEDPDAYQQYVWGIQYVDAPVVSFLDGNLDGDVADVGTDSTLYYTYDGNFNVTAVIKPDGTVAERYTYDPYGKVTFKAADWSDAASQAKSAYDNEILYCGYRFDPESGLYQVNNRYLNPPLGRWITRDPIGYAPNTHFTLLPCPQGRCNFPGMSTPCASSVTLRRPKLPTQYSDGMNVYLYVQSNPVNKVDPHGLITVECCYDMLGKALANPTVGAAYDKANAARDGLGIPCLHIVKCVKTSISDPRGAYNPFTRDVLMCANQLTSTQTTFNQVLLHELTHAESVCGWWKLGCRNCMIEEKRAFLSASECDTDESCTELAWGACIMSLSCSDQGDSKNNYLGVGWRPAP